MNESQPASFPKQRDQNVQCFFCLHHKDPEKTRQQHLPVTKIREVQVERQRLDGEVPRGEVEHRRHGAQPNHHRAVPERHLSANQKTENQNKEQPIRTQSEQDKEEPPRRYVPSPIQSECHLSANQNTGQQPPEYRQSEQRRTSNQRDTCPKQWTACAQSNSV